jgi:hypothetical protein
MRKLTAYLVIRCPTHNLLAGAIAPLSPNQLPAAFLRRAGILRLANTSARGR